jgi:hypothetical protein
LDAHHLYPKTPEFADNFANVDINPHSPWNIELLEHPLHMKGSAEYNKLWRQFWNDNPNASRSAVEHAVGFLMDMAFNKN